MIEKKSQVSLPERFPFHCQWEITCRCNLRCVMCYTDCFNTPEKIREELSTAEIKRIMDELAEAGCVELVLTGGEPLARPDFFEIYEDAKDKGFLVTIFTNATLITEAVAERFALLPPSRVEISLHGIKKKTFETITQGKGSYERCMKAIGLLSERNIPVVLKTTALTLNQNEILEIKHYAEGLGNMGYLLGEEIRLALDGSDIGGPFALSSSELDRLNQQDPKLWEEACEQKCEDKANCESGRYSFHIDAYGRLQLCSGNRREGYDLRRGSFREGFEKFLPNFPCSFKRLVPAASNAGTVQSAR